MARLRLRVTFDDDTTAWIDFDGEWRWEEADRVYRTAENPPQLEEVRVAWEIRGAAILTQDAGEVTGWARFEAFVDLFRDRDNPAVKVEWVVVDGTSETSVYTLGPPDYEGFQVDRLAGDEPFELDAQATNRQAWPVSMRFSARRMFTRDVELAGGTIVAGVVGLEQTVTEEWDEAGLGRLTWDTVVTTRAGVDARPKARAIGLIPRPGSTWTYEQNGTDGVSIENLDALDATNTGRVPSKVRAVCVVQQFGLDVGSGTPGSTPGRIFKSTVDLDDEEELVRRVTAEAVGPGAAAWVQRHAPAGAKLVETDDEPTGRRYRRTWEVRTSKGRGSLIVVSMALSGGGPPHDYEAVNGYRPVRFQGPDLWFVLEVQVDVQLRGGTGSLKELPLPALLPAPWELDRTPGASTEGAPFQAEPNRDPAKALWRRQARLVYTTPTIPTRHPHADMADAMKKTVETYLL